MYCSKNSVCENFELYKILCVEKESGGTKKIQPNVHLYPDSLFSQAEEDELKLSVSLSVSVCVCVLFIVISVLTRERERQCVLYISTSVRELRPRTLVEIDGKRRKTLEFN